MNQEQCLESLKTLLGEAVLFGTRLADNKYRGLLFDERNVHLRVAIDELHRRTAEFLAASPLDGITAEQVLPLYDEIQELARDRSIAA